MAKRFFTPIDLTGTISDASAPERAIKWNDGEGTLEVGLKGGNIKLPVGQEEITLCYNGTGGTLTKGTVVYISGAQGQRPSISKASASSESTSSKTFGIVSENIANGAEGFVTTFGVVSNVNTSAFTEGSALYLSTTAGEIVSTPQTPPNHTVFIGYCLKSNQSSGRIFVKVQNGYELQELHNVLITNPTTGQSIKYDSATGLWTNQNAEGGVFEVFYQNDAPVSPQLGDIWVDANENLPDYDAISINALVPNQSSNSGKYLTTNGSVVSWGSIDLSAYATTSSLSSYALLNSPTLTGTPSAPTASPGTNTTQIATTAFVQSATSSAVSNLIDSAPGALDTLNELAAAINDDANFASTITTALSGKEPTITSGTTSQYWRGDKSWQTLDKSSVGLGNVENTTLSTWAGSSSITTVGTIGSGTWQGSSISTTYTDAKVTSVNGSTGAISGLATLASPSFTGTANAERLSVDSTAFIDTVTTTVSSTSATEIDSFVQSSFSSCEYLIQIKQGSKVTILKALMTSVDLDIVQYGIVESGGTIPYTITTDSFIPGGGGSVTSKLFITITDANSTAATVKVVRTSVV